MVKNPKNYKNERGRRIARWLALIGQDRNYSRILLNLPLIPPLKPEVIDMARRFGYGASPSRGSSPENQ